MVLPRGNTVIPAKALGILTSPNAQRNQRVAGAELTPWEPVAAAYRIDENPGAGWYFYDRDCSSSNS